MFKKFFTYPVFLVIFLSIVGSLLFGFSIKYYAEGGKKFLYLKNIVYFIAEIPQPVINIISSKSLNPNKPTILRKHKDKKRFEQFIPNKRNALLVLPRYDHSLSRSVVDIVDLNNFEVIHTYKHDIAEMNAQVQNTEEFPRLKIDKLPIRFKYNHPLLLNDFSIVSNSNGSIQFKIDYWLEQWHLFYQNILYQYQSNKNCHFVVYEELTNANYIKTLLEKINFDKIENIDLNYFKNSNKQKINLYYSKDVYEDACNVYDNFF